LTLQDGPDILIIVIVVVVVVVDIVVVKVDRGKNDMEESNTMLAANYKYVEIPVSAFCTER